MAMDVRTTRFRTVQPHITNIGTGDKDVDLRLQSKTYLDVVIGQKVVFYCPGRSHPDVTMWVWDIYKRSNIDDMLDLTTIDAVFPGWTYEQSINEWRSFYSKKLEKGKGVIGFRVKNHPPPPPRSPPPQQPQLQPQARPHKQLQTDLPQPLIHKVCVLKQIDGTYIFLGRVRDSHELEPLSDEWLNDNLFNRNHRRRCLDNPGALSHAFNFVNNKICLHVHMFMDMHYKHSSHFNHTINFLFYFIYFFIFYFAS